MSVSGILLALIQQLPEVFEMMDEIKILQREIG
jgi:hypothetical protein